MKEVFKAIIDAAKYLMIGIGIYITLGLIFGYVTVHGAEVSHPWHKEKTYIDDGAKVVETDWKYVAKGWRPHMKPGHEPDGRFEPYSDYLDKWIIVHTNDVIQINSKPSRSKFQDKIDEMEPGYQKQKKLDQAAKKFGKNLEKERKNFEKYRDKAGTQEERDFWQTLLDTLPVPNEDTK